MDRRDVGCGGGPDEAVRAALVEGQAAIRVWLFRQLGGDAEAAAEVLAAFCLRALEAAPRLRDGAALRPWLSRILRSVLADHHRRERRRLRRSAPLEMAAEHPADHDLPCAETAVCECLESLLPTLAPAEADLIRRLDLCGEARADVAAALGIKQNALRVRLHRARAALRERFLEMCRHCVAAGLGPCACPQPLAEAL
ncbi:RNA polymerase sigma factor [Falsiroseomonas sp. CW058]|uniref:RNA polymerase sigma factor n=1 Tax=Falsiroseomonas sp. CW058 TaxID=3388664 RepID=UPI003D312026